MPSLQTQLHCLRTPATTTGDASWKRAMAAALIAFLPPCGTTTPTYAGQGRAMTDWFRSLPSKYFENARYSQLNFNVWDQKNKNRIYIVDEARGTLRVERDVKNGRPQIDLIKLRTKATQRLIFILLFQHPNASYLNIIEHKNQRFQDVTLEFLGEPVYCPSIFRDDCRMAALEDDHRTIVVYDRRRVLLARYIWNGEGFTKQVYAPRTERLESRSKN